MTATTEIDPSLQKRIDDLVQQCIDETDEDDLAFFYKHRTSIKEVIPTEKIVELIKDIVKGNKVIRPFSKYSLSAFNTQNMTLVVNIPINKVEENLPENFKNYSLIENFQDEITFYTSIIYDQIISQLTTFIESVIVPQESSVSKEDKSVIMMIFSSTSILVDEKSDKENRKMTIQFNF